VRDDDEAGITLLEVTITMALLSLVTVPAAMWLTTMQRSDLFVRDASRQLADSRLAVEAMSRTMRRATYAYGHSYNDSSIFHSAGDYNVTFYVDTNNDGIADKVSYDYDDATRSIRKTTTVPACAIDAATGRLACDYATGTVTKAVVVANVRNYDPGGCSAMTKSPVFSYYKVDRGTGQPTRLASSVGALTPGATDMNDLVDIAYVQFQVIVDVSPGRGPNCNELKTAVQLRNWRGTA
jgi:hypothetical protein